MRRRDEGDFRVGGSDRKWPTVTAALSAAIYRADHADREVQVGVFDGDRQVARVERHADRTVTARMIV